MFGIWARDSSLLTAVVLRLGKHACATAVEHPGDFGLVVWINNQRRSKKRVSGFQCAIWASTVHVRQTSAHAVVWNHGHVLDPKGQEDMFLEIAVER